MANQYFEPGEQRASKVKTLFERIATRYDLLNDLQSFGLHRHWKRRVIELARPQPGQRSLDLCCGTGDLTLGLKQRGSPAVGLDFSEGMLRIAKKRKGNPKKDFPAAVLNYVRADAQRVPFLEASFDVVTIGYGLRNLASWEAGLDEMCRVAKPGARLIVLDFGKPDNTMWRAVYFSYLRLFVPALGLIFCGSASAYAYILESLKQYPAQHGVAEKMRRSGLVNVRIINLLGGAMSINYGEKKK